MLYTIATMVKWKWTLFISIFQCKQIFHAFCTYFTYCSTHYDGCDSDSHGGLTGRDQSESCGFDPTCRPSPLLGKRSTVPTAHCTGAGLVSLNTLLWPPVRCLDWLGWAQARTGLQPELVTGGTV